MSQHYTQTREDKTAKMLERVLEILVYAEEPIELNHQIYKKINFSQGQIVNLIQEHATNEEHIQGIAFKDPSTISKSDRYKILISEAKTKRAKRLVEDCNLSVEGRELSVAELKLEIDRLLYDNETLKKTVNGLESIIRQAGIERMLENDKDLVSEPIDVDEKLIAVLEKLLLLGSENDFVVVEKGKGRVPSQVFFLGYKGQELLCNIDDLKSLNVTFDTDEYGKIVFIRKGVIDV